MSDSTTIFPAEAPTGPKGLHTELIKSRVPGWLHHAGAANRKKLRHGWVPGRVPYANPPRWFLDGAAHLRQALRDSQKRSLASSQALADALKGFKGIAEFAEPLLKAAIKSKFDIDLDVTQNSFFHVFREPVLLFTIQTRFREQSLLEAALQNFEEDEAFANGTALAPAKSLRLEFAQEPRPNALPTFQYRYTKGKLSITAEQFAALCRELDLGRQYQEHLSAVFEAADTAALVREKWVRAQKDAMEVHVHKARIKSEIEEAEYTMLLAIVSDSRSIPMFGRGPVGVTAVQMLGSTLSNMLVIGQNRWVFGERGRVVVYVPGAPLYPIKGYPSASEAARDFALNMRSPEFRSLIGSFVPARESQEFQRKLKNRLYDWKWKPVKGQISRWEGTFADNVNLDVKEEDIAAPVFETLFARHVARIKDDAKKLAVPVADVDREASWTHLQHLAELGMDFLNLAAFFVPFLGEVMLAVTAVQLSREVFQGIESWAQGDKEVAWAHFESVAENVIFMAALAGAGAAGAASGVESSALVDAMTPVTLPSGEVRLWQPDLTPYQSDLVLAADARPNALGQYEVDGKTYIRQAGKVYEKVYDPSLKRWRIKHPTDADAYQPILGSNGQGAWRHTLERPLEWDRLTLLRRIGHATEAYSDEQLLQIGDLSGVSDNTLRKMHMDHAAPPPELKDAIRVFEANQEVDRVMAQLNGELPINPSYFYAMPLVTEWPRWPAGRILEVFEGSEYSGRSIKYGSRHIQPDAELKPPIQVTRTHILNGQLYSRIVASLDEAEIVGMLGGEPSRVVAERALELSKQLATYAQTRQPAIFESAYVGTRTLPPEVVKLQRECPGLSEAAAREVLAQASGEELKRMQQNQRAPLSMLEKARWYAQQGREVRAYAGVQMENLACADSRRLALHALEKLPGWSGDVRLEVREGSINGALLDSIGSPTATTRKYLVKHGPNFQAFDELAQELNSLPAHGDNFFASIQHALPDQTRQALGFPDVNQGAQLQRAIVGYVKAHRSEVGRLMRRRTSRSKVFKAPVRVNEHVVGYYASGRGAGLRPSLQTRVNDLYPDLSPAQVRGFISRQRLAGLSDPGIFTLLQNRQREWQALETMLDQWVQAAAKHPDSLVSTRGRTRVAHDLKTSWRRSPLADESPEATRLTLSCFEPLPALPVDFAHVRELSLEFGSVNDANIDEVLGHFRGVKKLKVNGELSQVPDALGTLRGLTSLDFQTVRAVAADFSSRLNALVSLEELRLSMPRFVLSAEQRAELLGLDFSQMRNLRSLTIDTPLLKQWPAGVLGHPQLRVLDLGSTSIEAVPEALFEGNEALWPGLSLDWSKLPAATFKRSYHYVEHLEGHVHPQQMLEAYAFGKLFWTSDINAREMGNLFAEKWPDVDARIDALVAADEQYLQTFRHYWDDVAGVWKWPHSTTPERHLADALKRCWNDGLRQRMGATADVSVFEVTHISLADLPALPADNFSHIKTLRLKGLNAPAGKLPDFIRAFGAAESLDLSASGLTDLGFTPADLPQLRQLDLSNNRIAVTPGIQERFNGLQSVQMLRLRNNPLGSLNVSALTRLESLDLNATSLQLWPAGAQGLPELEVIDLRNNVFTQLPQIVLSNTDVLLKTTLAGSALSPQASAALSAARSRIELAKGLPDGALARFDAQDATRINLDQQTAFSISQRFLPVPEPLVIEGEQRFNQQLARLNPTLTQEQITQTLERLRAGDVTDVQLQTRISEWTQTHETLVRELNGWTLARVESASDASVTRDRGVAIRRMLQCWQDGVLPVDDGAGLELSLRELHLGDLPELPVKFSRVQTLDLTGVNLCEQSDGFLKGFPELKKLVLSGNRLEQLPAAVEGMGQLEQLEVADNQLSDRAALRQCLDALPSLRQLDLRSNRLSEVSLPLNSGLQRLDLSDNGLATWPTNALDANLTHLDLSGNNIEQLPVPLLNGGHDALVAGLDLSDNADLSLGTLEDLQRYAQAQELDTVAGLSLDELTTRINDYPSDPESGNDSGGDGEGDGGSDSENPEDVLAIPAVEGLPELQPLDLAIAPWLEANDPQAVARRTRFAQLQAEPGSERFFYTIAQLPATKEYRLARADLTRRVWEVIDAAAGNAELRTLVFEEAYTHQTCLDGRLLIFSGMEVRVHEYRALRNIPEGRLDLKGKALLDLSRQLFRMDRVDAIAKAAAEADLTDIGEEQISYRFALTSGWPDNLNLPGEVKHVMYGRALSGVEVASVRSSVLEAENSDAFFEDLIGREYWKQYLQEKYATQIEAFEQAQGQRHEAFEKANKNQSAEDYANAVVMLDIELKTERNQMLIDLSRQEVALADAPRSSGQEQQ